jgi:hypothetical protein
LLAGYPLPFTDINQFALSICANPYLCKLLFGIDSRLLASGMLIPVATNFTASSRNFSVHFPCGMRSIISLRSFYFTNEWTLFFQQTSVAFLFARRDQLAAGLAPAGVRPCWAHQQKRRPRPPFCFFIIY